MHPKLRQICFLLVMLFSCSFLFAQQRTISGIITNKDTREPLVGATVAIKGTDRITTTDQKGEFSISASDESVLKITMMGFAYLEIPVGKQTNIEVNLTVEKKEMEEKGLFVNPGGG